MYDQGAAIVIDAGSASIKAGFGGEDVPRSVMPSLAESLDLSPDELLSYRALRPKGVECYTEYAGAGKEEQGKRAVERGRVTNMDEMEKLLDNVYNMELSVYPDIHAPVLLTETPLRNKARRAEMAEMMFETFKVPALSTCNSAVLCLFASGRTRGLVLECGAGVSHAVPVFEGFALHHAIIKLDLAGQDVTFNLHKLLQEQGLDVSLDATRDIKEKLAFLGEPSGQTDFSDEYELPDGQTIQVSKESRRAAGEILFNPSSGLSEMATSSIEMCDKHLKSDLYGSVVLAGGTTMLPGFAEHFKRGMASAMQKKELFSNTPSVIPHPTAHEPGYNSQRKFAAWIGGSMFASLSTFKLMQVTKQEYEDAGEAIIHKKNCV